MRCSKCGADNREGRKFCAQCGSPFAAKCPRCGGSNEPGEKFCGECGAALGAPATAAPKKSVEPRIRLTDASASENLEGERKTVTALFADIKGSMELIEDLDPEEARAIVDPALKLMMEAVHHYGGYVAQSTGDGIFALFGAPIAHEDHPQRGLLAALRMQQELKRYSERTRAEGRLPIQVRVGVNTGEVVVRVLKTGEAHSEYVPVGHSISLAARMQALAPIGSIAATEQVRKLCEGYFAFAALGPTKVKGVSEPVNVHEVTGLGPLRTRLQRSASRGYTKFVGRDGEIEALHHAAEQARAGRGQIVAVVAEPGVGKSRLFHEFKAASQSGCMVLEAFCVSYGKASTYLPVLDLLRSYFDISPGDDERKRREKVTGRVVALDRSLENTLPYLFSLLGICEGNDPTAQMDGQIKKRRTHDAIKRIVLRESLNQPLMVIFEDLHWIDVECEALLNLLADSIGTAKILLLVNYRPEYSHGWDNKTYYARLRLDPLGRESAEEMLMSLLGQGDELVPLTRLIIDKTEGTPFFIEETVHALLDDGSLVLNGTMKLVRPLANLKIPSTVQAILASRIDRLPPNEKELLQTLAVVGREFPFSLVREVTEQSDDELHEMLNHLQLGEFIYEQAVVGDTEYVFKHALTQEVTYNSVLAERHKVLHERTGCAIEKLYADHIDDHLDALAYHYSRSANGDKAVDYLQLAARQCTMRSAELQALAYIDRSLEILQTLPESSSRSQQELALQIARGESLLPTQGWAAPEVGRAYGRARELCVSFGERGQSISVLYGLRLFHRWRLELQTARELDEQFLSIANELNFPAWVAKAHGALGTVLLWIGEFVAAREHFEQVRTPTGSIDNSLLSDARDYDQMAASLCYMAWDLAILGLLGQSIQIQRQVLSWAQGLARPFALAVALLFTSILDQFRGDAREAREHSATALSIAAEYGLPHVASMVTVIHGWARSYLGEAESGIVEMLHGIADAKATGIRTPTFLITPLIEIYLRDGCTKEALSLITETSETVHGTGHRLQEAELYRLQGELLLKTSHGGAQVETCFREAISIAKRQRAKWWEIRATTSLARLLRDTNRRDEAQAMLTDIYNWFTEGFDTPDLKDAKALLEELSA